MATKPFTGVVNLDASDSTPYRDPYTPARAPQGAPDILFIPYDDTGLAMWSPLVGAQRMLFQNGSPAN